MNNLGIPIYKKSILEQYKKAIDTIPLEEWFNIVSGDYYEEKDKIEGVFNKMEFAVQRINAYKRRMK